jgi:predicted XRE-type DNA-binding protein
MMKQKNSIITMSSGNVFKDFGVSNSEIHLLKADLAIAILKILKERRLTQQKASELLGVEQPEISKLKNGDFSRFRVERLFLFLNKLGRNVDIYVKKTRSHHPTQRVIAA